MRFLSIWSLSNHFQTKVFPSIKSNKKIKIVSVLTNKKNHDFKNKDCFKDKKKIISKNNFSYVYISSVNSIHYNYSKFALENKINVLCEKPICLKIDQLYNLKKERAQIQNQINFLRQEKFELENEKIKLQTDYKYIEELAREKYRMAKKGEKVFKVIDQKK